MQESTILEVEGDESEVSRIKLLVFLTGRNEVVEADLWGPLGAYLVKYTPERFEELGHKIDRGDYASHDIREYLLQRVGAAMSIGANEVNQRFSLATPCPTYTYKKLADSSQAGVHSLKQGKITSLIERSLDYVLFEIRPY